MKQPISPHDDAALRLDAGRELALRSVSESGHRIESIQGLRAVAVLAVVVFHADLPLLKGGFLGVDVFFAISGFVITALLRREMAAGRFTMTGFYIRRARRLIPALAVSLLLTAVVFCFAAPASMNSTLLPALVTSIFGVSNFYFASALDYFDSGISNPVLHTWSLGVEEQFYLVFPALALLLARGQRRHSLHRVAWVVGSLGLVSLCAAVWATATDRSAAFYLPWYRAWEFAAGATLAYSKLDWITPRIGRWLSWIGAAILGSSLVFYRESYLFPGLGAIAPVLGTVMLMAAARQGNGVNRVLVSPPMRWLGDASYSIYLAHWPVTCLIGMFFPLTQTYVSLAVIVLGIALGGLLWRCVEVPLRTPAISAPSPRRLLLIPLVMTSAAASLGLVAAVGNQVWQMNPLALKYLESARSDPDLFRLGTCFITQRRGYEHFDAEQCLRSDGRPSVLVIGDSLAANIALALAQRQADRAFLQATSVDYRPGNPAKWPIFTARLDRLVESKLSGTAEASVDQVILFARWDPDDLAPLLRYIEHLKARGVEATVLGPSPEFYFSLPLILAYSSITGIDLAPMLSKQDRHSLDREFSAALKGKAQYVSMMGAICGRQPEPRCEVARSDEALFFDKVHFTRLGATLFAARFPLF